MMRALPFSPPHPCVILFLKWLRDHWLKGFQTLPPGVRLPKLMSLIMVCFLGSIFPAKLNKRGERSFDAHWGEGVVERKPAQQAESWWQCRQKKELLKILSKKRNSHGTGSFIRTFLALSLALYLSPQESDLGFCTQVDSTDLIVTLKDNVTWACLGSAS